MRAEVWEDRGTMRQHILRCVPGHNRKHTYEHGETKRFHFKPLARNLVHWACGRKHVANL